MRESDSFLNFSKFLSVKSAVSLANMEKYLTNWFLETSSYKKTQKSLRAPKCFELNLEFVFDS